ncbi:MAG: dTDP-4-dehydrorhamnose reductase family protein [Thermoanaerobaculia bacterium]
MKKVLVLGGAGMLGHKVLQVLGPRFDIRATFRGDVDRYVSYGLISHERAVTGVDAMQFETVERAIRDVRPDYVINCIGVVKQLAEGHDPIISITVNSLFPHRVAAVCRETGARVIHVSTDCVFSGRKGMYLESDPPDAEDLYGRSKLLGEVAGENALTLRTSIIGREVRSTTGLVEWFLSNRGGTVNGFTEAIYSGLTTQALASLIGDLIEREEPLHGLYQVSSEPINKYDLLVLLNDAFGADVMIRRSTELRIDRSLDSARFREVAGWQPATWPEMVAALAHDPTPYELWRHS